MVSLALSSYLQNGVKRAFLHKTRMVYIVNIYKPPPYRLQPDSIPLFHQHVIYAAIVQPGAINTQAVTAALWKIGHPPQICYCFMAQNNHTASTQVARTQHPTLTSAL
jgi:hypothetical protein